MATSSRASAAPSSPSPARSSGCAACRAATRTSILILAATDPAQPYGAALPWPKRAEGRRPARTAGAYVLLRNGDPVVYVERGGKGIVRLIELEGEELTAAITELATAAQEKLIPKLGIERVDGEPVMGSGLEEQIIAAGFARQPRKLVAAG